MRVRQAVMTRVSILLKGLIQWRSQEFLSIGQFPSQTILRSGQPWAIEKAIGLVFSKLSTFIKVDVY
jgi:hypothetical protein